MSNVVYILQIIVALGLIILVHELGHFLTAKWFGVRVHRFAIGMGPVLVKWQRGETEYSLRWLLPLGGFVDLAGEHPSAQGGDDPRGLCNKPAWQRLVVFASGVAMNAALAVTLFTVAPLVGILVSTTEMGEPVPDMPAAAAGIQAGDRLVALDGEWVESFDDILNMIASQREGTAFHLTVERPVAGSAEPKRIEFEDVRSTRARGLMAPMIGVSPAFDTILEDVIPGSPEAQAGLQAGDRVASVNGEAVSRWHELARALEAAPAGPVALRIEREGQEKDVVVDPAKLKAFRWGMEPPSVIPGVEKGGPAEQAGVRAGDRIARLAAAPAAAAQPQGQTPGDDEKSWPTLDDVLETIRSAGADATVRLTLLRDGEYVDLVCQATVREGEDTPRIGITLAPAAGAPVQIGRVEAGGAAAKANLQPGDVILGIGKDDERPGRWDKMLASLAAHADEPTTLRVRRGRATLSLTYQPETEPLERFAMSERMSHVVYEPLPRIYNPAAAMERGLKRTYQMIGRAYSNLRQLLTRQVSTDMMLGPVGIVNVSMRLASYGLGTFMDFWGMLSVFIAVLNFLPIPPFDGGHALFVLIDKIKGSPVSLKTRQAFWLAGWIAVGILFLFVTFQDVRNLVVGY